MNTIRHPHHHTIRVVFVSFQSGFGHIKVSYTHPLVCLGLVFIYLSCGIKLRSPSREQKDTASSCQQPRHPGWAAARPSLRCQQQEPSAREGIFYRQSSQASYFCVAVPKLTLDSGLWVQTARCSLASPARTREIQILSGAADVPDWSRQVSRTNKLLLLLLLQRWSSSKDLIWKSISNQEGVTG